MRAPALGFLGFLLLPATLGFATLASAAPAETDWELTVLRAFTKPATNPVAPLVLHGDGDFYGVTPTGGTHGQGTLFRLQPDGIEILHSFSGADGAGPTAGLVSAGDGTLIGTTSTGGSQGFGTAFRFSPATGQLTPLVDFTGTNGAAAGSVPDGLVLHADGFLYGLTRAGGINGHGTAFRLDTAGTLTTLHHFAGGDGSEPRGPLTAVGNDLYGLCRSGGGSGFGNAFRLTTSGTFTSLFSFTGTAGTRRGANPAGGLALHSSGVLVGTTEFGGSAGFGSAFSLTTAAIPAFTTLHDFSDPTGSQPAGGLIEGVDGHLYGTGSTGGASGLGNLFRLTTTGSHSPLHDFSGDDGAAPVSGLAADAAGLLHGVTSAGGPGQFGRAFTLTTTGTFTPATPFSPPGGFTPSGAPVAEEPGTWLVPLARGGVHGAGTIARFAAGGGTLTATPLAADLGDTPDGALVAHNGGFAGVAARGGTNGRGTAFLYTAGMITKLSDFDTTGGSLAEGPLLAGPGGLLFGLAREGGSTARGTFFRIAGDGTRTRLLSFTGLSNEAPGREPRGSLVLTPTLNTYGATTLGGSDNLGTLFKVDPAGTHSIVAEFTEDDPRLPDGGLVTAADGMIYGTCRNGGDHGGGAIIRIDPATDAWSIVASFDPAAGSAPTGGLLAAPDGSLYGMTSSGDGGIFRHHPSGGLEILATLDADTTGIARSADESNLVHAGGLALDADGSLIGAVPGGGPGGGGVLFRLAAASPLAVWKSTELGDVDAPDLGNPDHDPLVNLVEYALDSDPTLPDPPLTPSLVDGRLEITLPRQPAHDDVTITLEATSDPSSPWQVLATSVDGQPFSGPGYVSGDAATPGLKSVLFRDTLAPAAGARRFLRLRVER